MASLEVPGDSVLSRNDLLARAYMLAMYPLQPPTQEQLPDLVQGLRDFLDKTAKAERVSVEMFPEEARNSVKEAFELLAQSNVSQDSAGQDTATANELEADSSKNINAGDESIDVEMEEAPTEAPSEETTTKAEPSTESKADASIKVESNDTAVEASDLLPEQVNAEITNDSSEASSLAPSAITSAKINNAGSTEEPKPESLILSTTSDKNEDLLSQSGLDERAIELRRKNRELSIAERNPRVLDFPEEESAKPNFLTYVMPDRIPEPPQSRRSLVDLYFTVQALPTSKLLPSSHKTLTTDQYKLSLLEGKLAVTYTRIEELKRNDKWSLRQRSKFRPPPREKVHHDYTIDEMRWMQSNVTQGHKLKIALCYELSQAVLEFFEQGRTLKPVPLSEEQTEETVPESEQSENVAQDEANEKEPLVVSSVVDEDEQDTGVNPADLEIVKVSNTKSFDSLIPFTTSDGDMFQQAFPSIVSADSLNSVSNEIFQSLNEIPALRQNPYMNEYDSLSITSLTKFLAAPDLSRGWRRVIVERPEALSDGLATVDPSVSAVGGIAGKVFQRHHHHDHEVRAPRPPDVRYMSYRAISIWLPHDDQKLMRLAKELTYNWDLISSYMSGTPTGGYTANVERRTPWQAFERWLQLTPSFELKDLRGRFAEPARIWLDTSSRAQLATKRRLAPVGVSSDNLQRGHKRLRWSSMLEGIRKAKRKRENQPKGNPMRRQAAIESSQSNGQSRPVPSASELSKIKFERDKAVAEAYAQQQRAAQAQVAAARLNRSSGPAGNASTQATPATPTPTNATRPATAPESSHPTLPADLNLPNPGLIGGSIAGLPLPSTVAAAAAAAAGNTRLTQEQIQQLIVEKRRRALQQQQQQQQQQAQALALAQAHAQGTPQAPVKEAPTGATAAFVGSRTGTPVGMPETATPSMVGGGVTAPISQQSAPGTTTAAPLVSREQVANLMRQIAQQNPTYTREQVQQLASQHVQRFIQNKRAQATKAAQLQAQKN